MTAPLVSAQVDLRDFPFMPLDVVRLRDSDLAAIASGDAFRAAVLLWCAAWHQIPAASLPDDDRMLARLSGYGRDLAAWAEVKADALRGFMLCDDGRLYHPVIAEKANDAWSAKAAQRARTSAAVAARRNVNRNDDRNDERNELQGTGTVEGIERPLENKKTRGREVSRISENWRPSVYDQEFAVEQGLSLSEVSAEVSAFRDHWLREPDGEQADWSAAWRGWVREGVKRRKKSNGARAGPKPAAPSEHEPYFDFGEVGRFSERMIRETAARGEWRTIWGPKRGEPGCRVPERVFTEART